MKNSIVGILMGVVLLAPVSVANAQSTLSPLQVSLLTQLIALLQQELNQLIMEESNTPADTVPNPQNDPVAAISAPIGTSSPDAVSFSVTPHITANATNPTMLDIHWETSVPATAVFYLQKYPNYTDIAQKEFEPATSFEYQVQDDTEHYQIYKIVVTTGTGESTSYSGQLLANQ